jgi:hypothetical protein
MKSSFVLLTLLTLASCTRLLASSDPSARADQRVQSDGVIGDLAPRDLPATMKDGVMADGQPAADAAPPCVATADPDTLALLTFEGSGDTAIDLTGQHPGTLVGKVDRVAGPSGCGSAVEFDEQKTNYVVIPDAPAWDLNTGSLDFWVRIDTAPSAKGVRGLVSRDAKLSAKPGHISIFQMCDGGIAVRLQGSGKESVRCSPPVALGAWHHIGVNFGAGALQLFVDGAEATRSDLQRCSFDLQCGTSTDNGIAGNDNPWVLGASSGSSDEGQAEPVSASFDGAIDSFRVSSVRRAFESGP